MAKKDNTEKEKRMKMCLAEREAVGLPELTEEQRKACEKIFEG